MFCWQRLISDRTWSIWIQATYQPRSSPLEIEYSDNITDSQASLSPLADANITHCNHHLDGHAETLTTTITVDKKKKLTKRKTKTATMAKMANWAIRSGERSSWGSQLSNDMPYGILSVMDCSYGLSTQSITACPYNL